MQINQIIRVAQVAPKQKPTQTQQPSPPPPPLPQMRRFSWHPTRSHAECMKRDYQRALVLRGVACRLRYVRYPRRSDKQALLSALQDKRPHVRAEATLLVAEFFLGSVQLVPKFIGMLKDSSLKVRIAAAKALAAFSSLKPPLPGTHEAKAVVALVQALKQNSSTEFRAAGLIALAGITGENTKVMEGLFKRYINRRTFNKFSYHAVEGVTSRHIRGYHSAAYFLIGLPPMTKRIVRYWGAIELMTKLAIIKKVWGARRRLDSAMVRHLRRISVNRRENPRVRAAARYELSKFNRPLRP